MNPDQEEYGDALYVIENAYRYGEPRTVLGQDVHRSGLQQAETIVDNYEDNNP